MPIWRGAEGVVAGRAGPRRRCSSLTTLNRGGGRAPGVLVGDRPPKTQRLPLATVTAARPPLGRLRPGDRGTEAATPQAP